MAKNVKRETTVTYRCDGCGNEDFKIDEHVQEDILPLGWGTILYVADVDPYVRTDDIKQTTAVSPRPFRKIICCHLCSKKLTDFFKSRQEEPPLCPLAERQPWWVRWFFG